MGKLDSFSFKIGYGRERRKVDGNDNVIWDDGDICVAVLVENSGLLRVDYGKGFLPEQGGTYPRIESANVPDLLTARCIALEWIATRGAKK